MRPIATRTGGASQPWSTEYLRKNTAASTSATPATAENILTPMNCSQSIRGTSNAGGVGGGGGGGSLRAAAGAGGAGGADAGGGAAIAGAVAGDGPADRGDAGVCTGATG